MSDANQADTHDRPLPSGSPESKPSTTCPEFERNGGICPICLRSTEGKRAFRRSDIVPGGSDALGNRISEILWLAQDYTIYRSRKGVYVQFSDCREVAYKQRARFATIGPKLCEIRYLTSRMGLARIGWRRGVSPNYYDHQIAQAMVDTLERSGAQIDADTHGSNTATGQKVSPNMELLSSVLAMAASRVTNENRVLYLVSCFVAGIILTGLATVLSDTVSIAQAYLAAGSFGALGAVFSIAMRVQRLDLIPCQESFMNSVMGALRVFIGMLSGGILVLLLYTTSISTGIEKLLSRGMTIDKMVGSPLTANALMYLAVIGILGGFAERLVPNLLDTATSEKDPVAKS